MIGSLINKDTIGKNLKKIIEQFARTGYIIYVTN